MKVSKKVGGYLNLAKRVAVQSEHDHFKHGAVLVKGGSVINASCNKDKFSRFGNRFRNTKVCGHATHHAELGCILGLDKNLTQGTTMYVVRMNRAGDLRLSKPCPMCEDILKFCGVKKVVYTTGDSTIKKIKL